ncbi:MAG: hypothetical protein FWC73_07700 [Defluviitaleaceae bacterium]|nr:hypothetical protein [Defluviitaleaceae bacterium]
MSEKNESLAKQQAKTKPKAEDIIASNLTGGERQNALAFLEYCKVKKISYPWSSTNRWNMKAKGKSIGWIDIGGERKGNADSSWYIDVDMRELRQYEDAIENEGLIDFVKKHLKICIGCASCAPGGNVTFFGEEFQNVCYGVSLYICNPDASTIENIQKLINIRLTIPRGTAARPLYDSATDGLARIDNKRISEISDMEGNTNENMCLLFDGKYDKYYYAGPYGEFKSDKTSHNIIFKLDEPVELAMYGLVTSMRTDAPRKWTLYGAVSMNGSWEKLDEHDEFPRPITSYTEKAFKISTPAPYQYYRINLEGWTFMVSQLHLYCKV